MESPLVQKRSTEQNEQIVLRESITADSKGECTPFYEVTWQWQPGGGADKNMVSLVDAGRPSVGIH